MRKTGARWSRCWATRTKKYAWPRPPACGKKRRSDKLNLIEFDWRNFVNRLILSLVLACCATSAFADGAAPAGPGGGLLGMAPWVAIFVIFYFLLVRPQQKQAKELQKMVDGLKRGDRVLTQGGLYGTVSAVKGKVLEVKL